MSILTNSWSTTLAFPTAANYLLGGLEHNGYLYTFGGGTAVADVYAARLDGDHKVLAWTKTSSLPAPLSFPLVLADGVNALVIGGTTTAGATVATSYMYALGASGASTYTGVQDLAYKAGGGRGCLVKDRDHVVLFGLSAAADTASLLVHTARLQGDGNLGPLHAQVDLPTSLKGFGVASHGNRVYIVGGISLAGVVQSNILMAKMDADGTLTPWTVVAQLPVIRVGCRAAVVEGNKLVVVGGRDVVAVDANQANVLSYNIGSDGGLSTSSVVNVMSTSARDGCLIFSEARRQLWYVGGLDDTSTATAAVQMLSLR